MTVHALSMPERYPPPPPVARRPALTALALLVAANPAVAAQLLYDPLGAAAAHPHYPIQLDEDDRQLLTSIQRRAASVHEFLDQLADAIEAPR